MWGVEMLKFTCIRKWVAVECTLHACILLSIKEVITVKKLLTFVSLFAIIATLGVPAFAEETEQVKNVKSGVRNASTGWVEVLDSAHAEAAKGKSAGEQVTGVAVGGVVGVRKAIHRMGAGAIDLLTFWIPKKQPLITPEKARLE